jgi:cell division protein FtsW (lipid II flippase)
MARLFAQLCTLVFLVVGVGGLFLGDASHVVNGQAQGNVGDVQLHLTYVRDVLDLILLVVFIFVGFVADRRTGRLVAGAAGIVLLALAIIGFFVGDNDAGAKSFAGMHFPTFINIFDLVVGVLAILAALGTIEDEGPTSIIRP